MFALSQQVTALKNVNLTIEQGEFAGIIGLSVEIHHLDHQLHAPY